MDFNIHDPSGVWIDIIEEPTSAIWVRRYRKPGEFQIYTPATAELLDTIAEDFYITRDDEKTVMIVEGVELTTNAENGDFVKITGRSASSMLDRRVILNQTTLSGRVDRAIYKIINENAINPADADRRLPLLMIAPDVMADAISAQHTGTNLLAATEEICAAYGIGFRAIYDDVSLVVPRIELYVGKNRSAAQEENAQVIFSPEFENLISSQYAFDMAKYKNVAIVAGEGEGKARKRAIYGAASGRLRRELYVDARDMSTNEGEISDADYTAQLEVRGAEKLAETQATEAFSGEVDTVNTFTLYEDYDVGDIVTVENEYGIRVDTRIAEVTEYWDANGYSTDCTFEGMEG